MPCPTPKAIFILSIWQILICVFAPDALSQQTNDCGLSVTAGRDSFLCNPSSLTLQGNISGDICGFYWSPSDGLTDPRSLNPQAWIDRDRTYTLNAISTSSLGSNLIFNPGFELGDTGFTSDYYWDPSGVLNEEAYFITTRGDFAKWDWDLCNDHTTGFGNMMCVNASTRGNVAIWCQDITVAPNTDYLFSMWLVSLFRDSPAELEFRINGEVIGPPFNANPTTCQWEQRCSFWNSNNTTNAQICIINLNTASWGNDFAIDDLEFREACVQKDSVSFTIHENWWPQNLVYECSADNLSYRLTFDIPQSNGNSHTVYGIGGTWNNGSFTTDYIPNGDTYNVTIEDNGQCQTQFLNIDYSCPCITDAGTLTPAEFTFCTDELANATGGMEMLDGDDVLLYYLLDHPDVALANRLDSNSIPVFAYTPALEIGRTYYILGAAGNEFNGSVYWPDSCLSLTQTVPIQFLAPPTASIGLPPVACEGDSVTINLRLGPGVYDGELTYGGQNLQLGGISDGFSFSILASTSIEIRLENLSRRSSPQCVNINPASATLQVLGSQSIPVISHLCTGDVLELSNQTVSSPGTFTDTLSSSLGCDSILLYEVFYHEPSITEGISWVCPPEMTGTDTFYYSTFWNCDSIHIVERRLLSSDTLDLTIPTCDVTLTGNQEVRQLRNAAGCDSIINIDYLILESDTTFLDRFSCDPDLTGTQEIEILTNQDNCDSLLIYEYNLSPADTTYLVLNSCDPQDKDRRTIEILNSNDNCDSILIYSYSINPSDTTYLQRHSCDPLDNGRMEMEILANRYNCDSVLIYEYIVDPSDLTTLFSYSCDPDDDGKIEETRLINQFGCDSIIRTSIIWAPADSTFFDLTTCNPGEAGERTELLINSSGCDSVLIFRTALLPSHFISRDTHTCDPNEAGVYTLNYFNEYGCDSIIEINTRFVDSDLTEIFVTTCEPQNAGVFEEVLLNSYQCDSLVRTTVELLPRDTLSYIELTCDSAALGQFQALYSNQYGCDSLVTTIVELNDIHQCNLEMSIWTDSIPCNDSTGGIHIQRILGAFPIKYVWTGPDSGEGILNGVGEITILDLLPGNYQVFFQSSNGLMQSLEVELPAIPSMEIEARVLSQYDGFSLPCDPLNPPVGGTLFVSAGVTVTSRKIYPLDYLWSNGCTESVCDNLTLGNFDVTVTNGEGCTAKGEIEITAPPPLEMELELSPISCFGNKDGSIQINANGGVPPYKYQIGFQDLQTINIFYGLGPGRYSIMVEDANGCQIHDLLWISNPAPLIAEIGWQDTLTLGDSLHLFVNTNTIWSSLDSVNWSPVLCQGCQNLVFQPLEAQWIEVQIIDEKGCRAEDQRYLPLEIRRGVFVPNVFTPNGDGVNDVFMIYADASVKNISNLSIFDRWGGLIHQALQCQPETESCSWNGHSYPVGVYTYQFRVEFIDGFQQWYKGDIAIVR